MKFVKILINVIPKNPFYFSSVTLRERRVKVKTLYNVKQIGFTNSQPLNAFSQLISENPNLTSNPLLSLFLLLRNTFSEIKGSESDLL